MKRHSRGFTLVEVMIVVAIIAILASILIPSIIRARTNARVARVASNLKTFAAGFHMYYNLNGALPADAHLTLPAGMTDFIAADDWSSDALGGTFNWEGPTWGEGGPYDYAGISLFGTTASLEELTMLDTALDDGNLSTGVFRQMSNGRYTYVIEE